MTARTPAITPSATIDLVLSYVKNPNVLPPPNIKIPVTILIQHRAGLLSQDTAEEVCGLYFEFGYEDLFPVTAPDIDKKTTTKTTKKTTTKEK